MSAFTLPLKINTDVDGTSIRINHGDGASERTIIGIAGNYLTLEQAEEIRISVNSHAALLEAVRALKELLKGTSVCHICTAALYVSEGPAHCEDCSWECENHDEPECVPVESLYATARAAIESLEKAGVKL